MAAPWVASLCYYHLITCYYIGFTTQSFSFFSQLQLPFSSTGIGTGGTFLAGVSEGARFRTLAAAADAAAPSTAHLTVLGDARRRVCGAVAVVANVAGVALALSAVTLAMTWSERGEKKKGNELHMSSDKSTCSISNSKVLCCFF